MHASLSRLALVAATAFAVGALFVNASLNPVASGEILSAQAATASQVPAIGRVAAGAVINQTACGCLSQADTTYVLQNDVSSNGSCFVITAANVTLDLNGKTVTYNNAAPVTVPNGDFESAPAGDWNLGTAPNASRTAGTYVKPVSVYSGSYAAKFTVPAADQNFRNGQAVTLAANTTYTLSAMFYNQASDPAAVSVELEGTTIKVSKTGKTWRGFQYTTATFTTGASAPSYNVIVRLAGATSGSGSVFVDDIRIQRHRNVGVAVGASSSSSNRPSDISCYGTPNGMIVKNGTIRQGQANGSSSDAVYIGTNNVEIANLNMTVQGPNSRGITSPNYKRTLNIHNNTIANNTRTIASREAFDGAAVLAIDPGGSTFANNTITNSPQNGVMFMGNSSGIPNTIRNNSITIRSYYTNDFAIQFWNDRSTQVYGNTINCTGGDLSCRGIFAGGNSQGTTIYNNTINNQERARNQEYNGCAAGGAYGLQIEYASNIVAYGNTITSTAEECESAAFRANPVSDAGLYGQNNYVHDNTFTANKIGSGTANGMLIGGMNSSSILRFENNSVTSNDKWMNVDGASTGLVFKGNTFSVGANATNPFLPLYTFDWNPPKNAAVNFSFIDNAYPTTFSQNTFEAASFVCVNPGNPCAVGGGSAVDKYSDFTYSWTTTVSVRDGSAAVAGASVNAVDRNGATVASGTTDASGRVALVLPEWKNTGGTKAQKNPYVISAALGNVSTAGNLTADHPQTVTLNLAGAGSQDLIAPGRVTDLVAQ